MKLLPNDLARLALRSRLPPSLAVALAYTHMWRPKGKRFYNATLRAAGISEPLPSESWKEPLPLKAQAELSLGASVQRLNEMYPMGEVYDEIALRHLAWSCTQLIRILQEERAAGYPFARADRPTSDVYETEHPAVIDEFGAKNPINSPTGRNAIFGDLMQILNTRSNQQ